MCLADFRRVLLHSHVLWAGVLGSSMVIHLDWSKLVNLGPQVPASKSISACWGCGTYLAGVVSNLAQELKHALLELTQPLPAAMPNYQRTCSSWSVSICCLRLGVTNVTFSCRPYNPVLPKLWHFIHACLSSALTTVHCHQDTSHFFTEGQIWTP